MTEHPTELLLEVASGAVPPPEARAHLAACRRCRGALEAMAPLDLGYVWQGVAAELDAPPGPACWNGSWWRPGCGRGWPGSR
jgi:hypothetical protein